MKITDIQKQKGKNYFLYVDGSYFCSVNYDMIYLNNIQIGQEYSSEFLNEILVKSQMKKAKDYAFYLISLKDYSKYEIKSKLLKKYSLEICEEVCTYLENMGFINDEKYCKRLVEHFLYNKGYGCSKIKYELKFRGIDEYIIESCVSNDIANITEIIYNIIEKKYYRYVNDLKGNHKIINSLLRRGFEYSDIKLALNQYKDNQVV